jgi:hypothetical protein
MRERWVPESPPVGRTMGDKGGKLGDCGNRRCETTGGGGPPPSHRHGCESHHESRPQGRGNACEQLHDAAVCRWRGICTHIDGRCIAEHGDTRQTWLRHSSVCQPMHGWEPCNTRTVAYGTALVILSGTTANCRTCAEPFSQTIANGPVWYANLFQNASYASVYAVVGGQSSAAADAAAVANAVSLDRHKDD